MTSANPVSRVALVTGAAAGIGRACVERFLASGHHVALVDVDVLATERTRADLDPEGDRTLAIACDVSDEQSVVDAVQQIVARWGRLDVAHNNAGVTSSGPLTHELERTAWDRTVDIDLTGVWLCMKAEVAVMLQQGHGAIVNTASIAGHGGYPQAAAYAAAKHGVVGLTRTAAVEYGARGIRVNAVSPGPVQSDMLDKSLARRGPAVRDWYLDNTPMRRFATLDEVAHAVHWLASDEASFVTGHCLPVDGGWTAH
ncbi:SDR family NAD(P)-dependent oxidoreductase [Pimelobacter simplex]|uniref:SDR family NAD(P)-dependent oxidoreductase n=1 Tax=Nocardioides simplex TaxID=2045 RepID=UPI003AAF4AE3